MIPFLLRSLSNNANCNCCNKSPFKRRPLTTTAATRTAIAEISSHGNSGPRNFGGEGEPCKWAPGRTTMDARTGRTPKRGQSVSQSVSQSPRADNWCEIGPLLARSWPHAWQVMHLREREAKPLGTSIYDVSTEGEGHKMHQIG